MNHQELQAEWNRLRLDLDAPDLAVDLPGSEDQSPEAVAARDSIATACFRMGADELARALWQTCFILSSQPIGFAHKLLTVTPPDDMPNVLNVLSRDLAKRDKCGEPRILVTSCYFVALLDCRYEFKAMPIRTDGSEFAMEVRAGLAASLEENRLPQAALYLLLRNFGHDQTRFSDAQVVAVRSNVLRLSQINAIQLQQQVCRLGNIESLIGTLPWPVLPSGVGGQPIGVGGGAWAALRPEEICLSERLVFLRSLQPKAWYKASGLNESGYVVAVFDGVAIADNPNYGNALYACDEEIWRDVFRLDKQAARLAGAQPIRHTEGWEARLRYRIENARAIKHQRSARIESKHGRPARVSLPPVMPTNEPTAQINDQSTKARPGPDLAKGAWIPAPKKKRSLLKRIAGWVLHGWRN